MGYDEDFGWIDTKFEDVALEELQEENANLRQKVESLEAVCEELAGKVKWLEDFAKGFNIWSRED